MLTIIQNFLYFWANNNRQAAEDALDTASVASKLEAAVLLP